LLQARDRPVLPMPILGLTQLHQTRHDDALSGSFHKKHTSVCFLAHTDRPREYWL
jgi:hypothetical protein